MFWSFLTSCVIRLGRGGHEKSRNHLSLLAIPYEQQADYFLVSLYQ